MLSVHSVQVVLISSLSTLLWPSAPGRNLTQQAQKTVPRVRRVTGFSALMCGNIIQMTEAQPEDFKYYSWMLRNLFIFGSACIFYTGGLVPASLRQGRPELGLVCSRTVIFVTQAFCEHRALV